VKPHQQTADDRKTLRVVVVLDCVAALAAYLGAFAVRFYLPLPFTQDYIPISRFAEVQHLVLMIIITQLGMLYFFGLYDLRELRNRERVFVNSFSGTGIQALLLIGIYFFSGNTFFPRSVLLIFWMLNALSVVSIRRAAMKWILEGGPRHVLLVGSPGDIRALSQQLDDLEVNQQVRIVGYVSPGEENEEERFLFPCLGTMRDLPSILDRQTMDDVVLVSDLNWKDDLIGSLCQRKEAMPRIAVLPSIYDILIGKINYVRMRDIPLIEIIRDPNEDFLFRVKQVTDRILSLVLLIAGLPALGVASLLIKIFSPGPIFYTQDRVGKKGKLFKMYKIRTMLEGAEEETGPTLANSNDHRVTRIGRFFRASRIDEIPQLFNVLNGTMSLIGPRPERPEFVSEFLKAIPGYTERFRIRPGLTGLAQVSGDYSSSPANKLKYDLAYIYNYSLLLDLRIMAETVKVILTKRGV
jgi:exopolysaccharide biosynthesis polyprenyl glycosylphosphotransferase